MWTVMISVEALTQVGQETEVLGESVLVAIGGVHGSFFCERPSRLRAKMFFVFVYA